MCVAVAFNFKFAFMYWNLQTSIFNRLISGAQEVDFY